MTSITQDHENSQEKPDNMNTQASVITTEHHDTHEAHHHYTLTMCICGELYIGYIAIA